MDKARSEMRLNVEKQLHYIDESEQKIKRRVVSQYRYTKVEELCYLYGETKAKTEKCHVIKRHVITHPVLLWIHKKG